MGLRRSLSDPVTATAAALLVYGGASLPAPPGVGVPEILLGGLLLTALAGSYAAWTAPLQPVPPRPVPPGGRLGLTAFLLLLWLGTGRGLAMGWDPADLLRDVVPLGFLFLPVLLGPALARVGPGRLDLLALALAAAGALFALRWWIGVGKTVLALGRAPLAEGAGYLLNSSTVAFAAVFLPLWALDRFPARRCWHAAAALGALAGGLSALLALAASVHRAALLLSLAMLALGIARRILQRPRLFPALLALVLLLLPVMADLVVALAGLVLEKTEAVGLNNRTAEFQAVLAQIGRHPAAFLLGDGWGALLDNPAVGYWRVSYTHNLASYMLVKTGVIGIGVLAIYFGSLLPRVLATALWKPDFIFSGLPPLLSGLVLHTSYKYLCFGLVLTLLTASPFRSEKAG